MNRRNFLSLLGMTAGGVLLDQAIPFNRVWSFPKNIVVPQANRFLTVDEVTRECFRIFEANLKDAVLGGELGTLYGFDCDSETNVGSHLSSLAFPRAS